ncbi:MAG: LeuA family protein [Promethearchaeota archaeon]
MKYRFSSKEVRDQLYDYNFDAGVLPDGHPTKVDIWDETLRDGEQSPGVYLTQKDKITIAKALDEIGVPLVAVGFPAVSKTELETVKAITREGYTNSKILAIARPRKGDIDACIQANVDEIVLFMPTSQLMMNILKITPEKGIEIIHEMITYARDHGLAVNWVSEDASRAQWDHLKNVHKAAVECGVKRIVIGDTVGVLTPSSISHLIQKTKEAVKGINGSVGLGVHMHNDFGLAVANTVEAVLHGAQFPHTCVNGYGERAGNAAFEEVVMNLERLGIKTGIKLDKLFELSQLVEKLFCLPLNMHKPVVGPFSFSHESGLHVNAILTHPLTYEPINPKVVGRRRKFYLGKLSGSGAIINALSEKLKLINMDFPKEVLSEIVQKVKEHQEKAPKDEIRKIYDRIKKDLAKITSGVSDKEFYKIVREIVGTDLKDYLKDNKNKNLMNP